MYWSFKRIELIQEVLKNIKENNPVFQTRRHLLKSSLRLTPTLAPVLYEIGNHCKNVLRLKADIEFFVYQSDLFNASCYPPDTNKLYSFYLQVSLNVSKRMTYFCNWT